MKEKLFRSICRCGLCGKSMVYTSKDILLCNNYKRSGGSRCKYHTVKESEILDIIKRHAETYGNNIIMTNEYMKQYVQSIWIMSNGCYEINYNNGEKSSWNGFVLRI